MKLAFVLDPLDSIKTHKDSSFAMMKEAVRGGIRYLRYSRKGFVLRDGKVLVMRANSC